MIWFGPGLLGLNAHEGATAAVVLGREEKPVDALEADARALFGDRGKPLAFVAPDADGRRILPEVPLAYDMTGGPGRAGLARAHPDPRIRALQRQGREAMARQAVERLRLACGLRVKRVVIACKIPVPGLPVDRLASWAELAPDRLERALAEAGGVLRLSAAGLAADAPRTFVTTRAAEDFMRRERAGGSNVSGVCRPYAVRLDAAAKAHGVRSSMRLRGCPAAIASRVATR